MIRIQPGVAAVPVPGEGVPWFQEWLGPRLSPGQFKKERFFFCGLDPDPAASSPFSLAFQEKGLEKRKMSFSVKSQYFLFRDGLLGSILRGVCNCVYGLD